MEAVHENTGPLHVPFRTDLIMDIYKCHICGRVYDLTENLRTPMTPSCFSSLCHDVFNFYAFFKDGIVPIFVARPKMNVLVELLTEASLICVHCVFGSNLKCAKFTNFLDLKVQRENIIETFDVESTLTTFQTTFLTPRSFHKYCGTMKPIKVLEKGGNESFSILDYLINTTCCFSFPLQLLRRLLSVRHANPP